MKKTRVLYITQEITPHLPETPLSKIGRFLPQGIQEEGKEIRTFMPKYGCINERRHQLHEVIRLSGMNLIIDDADHPLIIKVASIQPARMQVYFIDNEEYFKRKAVFTDADGKQFKDNDERAIFFCRGVIETVRKLGWAPDIIHCHGWMTGLVPMYLKKSFDTDPIYADTKVVYSLYNDETNGSLNKDFARKSLFDGVTMEDLSAVETPTYNNLQKLGAQYADGIIMGEETINAELNSYITSLEKPLLECQLEESYIEQYSQFYDAILETEEVLVE
ncbi:MAG: glycogen/starch synthase [Flavobacteriales bacterium]|jgi:starch synthase|nr:glycogen/starch synthase [Flavobacteriales bacterium]MBT6747023.1 glycogen/starch synthase [Flavobacteriales bacterium]